MSRGSGIWRLIVDDDQLLLQMDVVCVCFFSCNDGFSSCYQQPPISDPNHILVPTQWRRRWPMLAMALFDDSMGVCRFIIVSSPAANDADDRLRLFESTKSHRGDFMVT